MNDHHDRRAGLRYTATGALAALAAVGAIAGSAALARPHHRRHAQSAAARGGATKTPTSPTPSKSHTSQPGADQPFLNDVQQLINAGTISASEARVLDRQIRSGMVDTRTLASSGFTPAQLQAVQQKLTNTKRALAPKTPLQHK